MFCFPNAFGRRERLQGAADCTGVPTERIGRWRKRKNMSPVLAPAASSAERGDRVRVGSDSQEKPPTPRASECEGHEEKRAAAATPTLPVSDSQGKTAAVPPTLPESECEGHEEKRAAAATPTLPVSDSQDKPAAAPPTPPASEGEGHEENRAAAGTPTLPVSDSQGNTAAAPPTLSESECEGHEEKRAAETTPTLPVSDSQDKTAAAPPTPPASEGEGHEEMRVAPSPTLPVSDSEGCEDKRVAVTPSLPVSDNEGCEDKKAVGTLTLSVNDSECCEEKMVAKTLTLPVSVSKGCEGKKAVEVYLTLSVNESEGHEEKKVVKTLILPVSDIKDCDEKKAAETPTLPASESKDCDEKKAAETPTLPASDSKDCDEKKAAETPTLPASESKDCDEKKAAENPTLPASESKDCDVKKAAETPNLPVSDSKDCDEKKAAETLAPPVEAIKAKAPLSPSLSSGPRFKLVHEGDIQVCYLNHARTVVSKMLSSKFLRRWETHRLYLNDSNISSKTPNGVFDVSVTYSSMEEVYVVTRWDAGHKFCIRVVIEDGSLLLQASSSYIRDQWFHSILWKKNIFKYRNILKPSSRPEVVLKELKSLVRYSTTNPLHDECVIGTPIQIVSDLLAPEETTHRCRSASGEMITTMAPLLENTTPSPELCHFFSDHCVNYPRSAVVTETLTPVVQRTLIHNVDFGKNPNMRQFIHDYIKALYQQNGGEEVVQKFITSIHGPGSVCPHLRVLPNLVSVCIAAVSSVFEYAYLSQDEDQEKDMNQTLQCFMSVTLYISEYEDWRPELAQLLQPVPFPPKALSNKLFLVNIVPVMKHIIADSKCDVQDIVLGVREGKQSWLHVFCPSENKVVVDDGTVWCLMVERLLACCSRRKLFLSLLVTQLGACFLLALRGHSAAQDALCLMLEWELIEQEDQKLQIVTTLQSTETGRERYTELCQRQLHLKELQKGGPRKLTLPSRSTDEDIARLLSGGSFGNLACLSLAFTHVTSSCASELIKLPALRYLNLWATQFGDPGLLMISEHLLKLQVLNLCETPVTDAGIAALSSMTNLRKLNLNSTKLSASTFECLRKQLPELVEFDVRYTEAWSHTEMARLLNAKCRRITVREVDRIR